MCEFPSHFVTLTYDDEHLRSSSLCYSDFQKFIRTLRQSLRRSWRKSFGSLDGYRPVRFFMAGEYGERRRRPHFHACLFGLDLADRISWRTTASGFAHFRSPFLERFWPHGHVELGSLTLESARYVASYCVKKISGRASSEAYRSVDRDTGEVSSLAPEFGRMSLKPGIGFSWISKFYTDVFPRDFVVVQGRKLPVPKYYDSWLKVHRPEMYERLQLQRYQVSCSRANDSTSARLEVRERVALAGVSQSKRKL